MKFNKLKKNEKIALMIVLALLLFSCIKQPPLGYGGGGGAGGGGSGGLFDWLFVSPTPPVYVTPTPYYPYPTVYFSVTPTAYPSVYPSYAPTTYVSPTPIPYGGYGSCASAAAALGKEFWAVNPPATSNLEDCLKYADSYCNQFGWWTTMYDWFSPDCCVWNCSGSFVG